MNNWHFKFNITNISKGFMGGAKYSDFVFNSNIERVIMNVYESDIEAKNIGPTIMSGRVVDLAVNPENPTEFYVAYATGGLWYTNNNGTSFSPVMDSAETVNCGSVTVDWKSETIWVGTGEVNASRSSYAGVGVLKSTNNQLKLSVKVFLYCIW